MIVTQPPFPEEVRHVAKKRKKERQRPRIADLNQRYERTAAKRDRLYTARDEAEEAGDLKLAKDLDRKAERQRQLTAWLAWKIRCWWDTYRPGDEI